MVSGDTFVSVGVRIGAASLCIIFHGVGYSCFEGNPFWQVTFRNGNRLPHRADLGGRGSAAADFVAAHEGCNFSCRHDQSGG